MQDNAKDAQRRAALERANDVRAHRAELKRALKARTVTLDEVLDGDDPMIASMRTFDLLIAVPGLGHFKVMNAMKAAHITPPRPFGSVTRRERRLLYEHLCETPAGRYATIGGSARGPVRRDREGALA
jgi:hypothetical protein